MAGPARSSSRLGLTLQGYDQVIALSQSNINESLEYNFTANKHLCDFDVSIKELKTAMKGTLNPPTVQLIDLEDADQALFIIAFDDGNYSFWDLSGDDPVKVKLPLAGWKLAFYVDFSLKKMNQIPANIRKELVEVPGAYSVDQLLIDFGTAELSTFSWEKSDFPGLTAGNQDVAKANITQFVNTYLQQLRGPGTHNVLGYAVKVNPPKAGQSKDDLLKQVSNGAPSFPPTSLRLQTINHRPNGEKNASSSANDHNAFLFTEMTDYRDLPGKDLDWSGDWFYEAIGGTLAMSKRIFWDRFLAERLKIANKEGLKVANKVVQYLSAPTFNGRVDWFLSDNEPGIDELNWKSGHGPNLGSSFEWNRFKEHHYTNKIDWKPDELWNLKVHSQIITSAFPVVGESKVIVEHSLKVNTDLNMSWDGHILKHAANNSVNTTATVSWTTELTFHAVASGGGLSVKATTLDPTVTCTATGNLSGMIKLYPLLALTINAIINGNLDGYRAFVKSALDEMQPWNYIAGKITEALNGQGKFIFPGGGTFEMKDPIFSEAGDLLIGLTYKKGEGPE